MTSKNPNLEEKIVDYLNINSNARPRIYFKIKTFLSKINTNWRYRYKNN